jgi:hypothetical protein
MKTERRIEHLRAELRDAETGLPLASTKKERQRLEKIISGILSRLDVYGVAAYELTDDRFDGLPLNYRAR